MALDAFPGHPRSVRSVGVGADGRVLLSVSLSADGRRAAAGTYDRKILAWERQWDGA